MKKLLVLLLLLFFVGQKSVYSQVDPVSLVVGKFLQKHIEFFISIERLKYAGPIEGPKLINDAYKNAVKKVNKHYGVTLRDYDKKIKEVEGWRESEQNQKRISNLKSNKERVESKKSADLEKLKRQRDETIKTFSSKYWNNKEYYKTIMY